MRILICGGHFSPALAIIEALPKNTDILYVGRKYALEGEQTLSLEYQIITEKNIPFAAIKTGRLQRKWTKHTLPSLLKLPVGFLDALSIIKKFKPTIIMGFGSYVQVPLCIIGYFLGIPIIIHEQTLEAGLANKLVARFATKVCISWQSSSTFFPQEKLVHTGNPALSSITTMKKVPKEQIHDPSKLPSLLIIGGSQGSHAINTFVKETLSELTKNYFVTHQTGDSKEFHDFYILQKEQEKLPEKLKQRYTLVKFFPPEKMIKQFQYADIVISRGGINTITTLLILQKPSLIIPLPFSQNNEQQKNALFLKNYGLGEILTQNTITNQSFLSTIHAMIHNKAHYYNKKNPEDLTLQKDAVKKIIALLIYAQKDSSQKKN